MRISLMLSPTVCSCLAVWHKTRKKKQTEGKVPLSLSLYRFESNVRSATVVGMVGAGGIGVTLWEAIRGFQFQQTCALMVLIIVTVSLLDFLSQRLRKHFI